MAWKGQPDGVVAGPAEEKDDCDGAKVVVAAPEDGDHFTVE